MDNPRAAGKHFSVCYITFFESRNRNGMQTGKNGFYLLKANYLFRLVPFYRVEPKGRFEPEVNTWLDDHAINTPGMHVDEL